MNINLIKAILAVMKEVKGIDKTLTVGSGSNTYKGVSDQVVKQVIGGAMEKNGLTIVPIGIEAKTKVDRWEEVDSYSKVGAMKQKQSILTEVTTKYLLMHESGESMELAGYGHGVDSQDKSAGKATTYALKYVLLYTFLVPTGKIDDTDSEHSDTKDVPKASTSPKTAPKSVSKPKDVQSDETPIQAAKNAVKGTVTILELNTTKFHISKSTKLTDDEKEELYFLIDEKLETMDPTK